MTCPTVMHNIKGEATRVCGGTMLLRKGKPPFWVCLNPNCGTAKRAT